MKEMKRFHLFGLRFIFCFQLWLVVAVSADEIAEDAADKAGCFLIPTANRTMGRAFGLRAGWR
jgi:hypothetical protein